MLTDVRVHRTGALVTVALAGWLTLETAPEVRGVLLKCLTDCPSGLVVDLRDLVVDSDLPLTLFPTIARQAPSWPGGRPRRGRLTGSPPPAPARHHAQGGPPRAGGRGGLGGRVWWGFPPSSGTARPPRVEGGWGRGGGGSGLLCRRRGGPCGGPPP